MTDLKTMTVRHAQLLLVPQELIVVSRTLRP
jgi:hypothetical protein